MSNRQKNRGLGRGLSALMADVSSDQTAQSEVAESGPRRPDLLVPIEQVDDGTGTPLDPERFIADLAEVLTEVTSDPETARRMGEAGRQRAEEHFAWTSIAERTRRIYDSLLP